MPAGRRRLHRVEQAGRQELTGEEGGVESGNVGCGGDDAAGGPADGGALDRGGVEQRVQAR
jgi:hypothetical protein